MIGWFSELLNSIQGEMGRRQTDFGFVQVFMAHEGRAR